MTEVLAQIDAVLAEAESVLTKGGPQLLAAFGLLHAAAVLAVAEPATA